MGVRRLPWVCTKCGTPKVETDEGEAALDRLMPTLNPEVMVGYCGKCKSKKLFKRESSA